MAKTKVDEIVSEDFDAVDEPVRKVSKEERELSRLLKETGLKYRDAGAALAKGDDVGFTNAMSLIVTYQELFGKLSTMYATDITAEGLANAAEM